MCEWVVCPPELCQRPQAGGGERRRRMLAGTPLPASSFLSDLGSAVGRHSEEGRGRPETGEEGEQGA